MSAAYETIGPDFAIDSLSTHFVAGPDPKLPLRCRVQRLNDGGRFVTRTVSLEQEGKRKVFVTCSFVRYEALGGPSMTHCMPRQSHQLIDKITLDDLELAKNSLGPYMKFQRLPLIPISTATTSPIESTPDAMVYTAVGTISPALSSKNPKIHALAIIALSDYHVLDAAPTLHGRTFGLAHIDDTTRTPTGHDFKLYTTLNHTIHFHRHERYRADELCYIEVTSPWAGRRRAEMQSRIFDRRGGLVATCVQEAYYVLKEEEKSSRL